jgi:hypothetical protein
MIIVASVLTKTHSTTRFFAVCERNRDSWYFSASVLLRRSPSNPEREPLSHEARASGERARPPAYG